MGPRLTAQLQPLGIETAADPEALRQRFSVTLARTVLELQGQSCIDPGELAGTRQQIMVSRSFGRSVEALEGLQEVVAAHTSNAAVKLRAQGSMAQAILVFARTGGFDASQPQYSGSRMVPLATPTQDTRQLTKAALAGLATLFRPGFRYKKAGVMLVDLSPAGQQQQDLLSGDTDRSQRLIGVLDELNRRMGRGTAFFAQEGVRKAWCLRAEMKSKAFTTDWKQLAIVLAR